MVLSLQKSAYAARELNYQGVFVYQNGKQDQLSTNYPYESIAGREMTRNVVLDNSPKPGQAREVYRQGDSDIVIHAPKQPKNGD